jgi:hypothetical protein
MKRERERRVGYRWTRQISRVCGVKSKVVCCWLAVRLPSGTSSWQLLEADGGRRASGPQHHSAAQFPYGFGHPLEHLQLRGRPDRLDRHLLLILTRLRIVGVMDNLT